MFPVRYKTLRFARYREYSERRHFILQLETVVSKYGSCSVRYLCRLYFMVDCGFLTRRRLRACTHACSLWCTLYKQFRPQLPLVTGCSRMLHCHFSSPQLLPGHAATSNGGDAHTSHCCSAMRNSGLCRASVLQLADLQLLE